jgi:Ca2+-binding EF-hand superfamily protein
MKSAWLKWAMEHHTFSNVSLSAREVNGLSEAVKETLDDLDPTTGTAKLLSVKYGSLDKLKDSRLDDQKIKNSLWLRAAAALWTEANISLREQINEGIANNGIVVTAKFEGKAAGDGGFTNLVEAEAKAKSDAESGKGAKSSSSSAGAALKPNAGGNADGKGPSRAKLEKMVLNRLALGRMREWIDDDDDRKLAETKALKDEKDRMSDHLHKKFVERKEEEAAIRLKEERAKKNSAEARKKASKEEEAKKLSAESFTKWVVQKEMREQSQRCLSLMPQPQLPRNSNPFTQSITKQVVKVGQALKKIDRTLVQEWAKWAEDVFNFNTANILWDGMAPIACDMHCAAHSALKSTFSRLLTPGKDYTAIFQDYARKLVRHNYSKDPKKDIDDLDHDEELMEDETSKINLNRSHMNKLLQFMDIKVKPQQVRALMDAFDSNQDGTVSFSEFTDFIDEGKKAVKCCWFTTCPKTGMANAYSVSEPTKKQARAEGKSAESKSESKDDDDYDDDEFGTEAPGLTVIRKLANGEKRIMVELQDRKRREDLLARYGILGYSDKDRDDDDFDDTKKIDKDACAFSTWSNDARKNGIRFLIDETRQAREEEALKKMLTEGKPPQPPKFNVAKSYSHASSTELTMCWEPEYNDLVSFFCMESSGPTGQAKEGKFEEIYRDPPNAGPDSQFSLNYTMRNLKPGTSYQFRIRGFNGFGPGEYTYRIFTTRTDAPPPPRVMKLSSDSVTLRWSFSEQFYVRMDELSKMFKRIDADNSGAVSRRELASALEQHANDNSVLRSFLLKKADSIGVDITSGCDALFDAIEGDDNGDISWEEFEAFFLSLGWADTVPGRTSISQSVRTSVGGSGSKGGSKTSDLTYVVEKCENEFDGIYKECLKTSAGHGTISRLIPGSSYRFRVYSINAAGVPGPKSSDMVVHAMIETPASPQPVNIGDRSITLHWKARGHSSSMRDPSTVNKLLCDWAGNHDSADGGVSIELAFAKYDKNRNGDIDASELAVMLADLGVEPTQERLGEAFDLLDANGDGIITFEEFAAWWRRDDASYTLKRSNPQAAVVKSNLRDSQEGSVRKSGGGLTAISEGKSTSNGKSTSLVNKQVGTPITVYRGDETRYEVAGLEPNRLYHFKLRLMGSRCNSQLSHPQALMTAPTAPSLPIILDVQSTIVRLKWYSPRGGAYKFAVQLRQCGRNRVGAAAQDPSPGASNGWITVFNGQETIWQSTTMVPDSQYDVRVIGVNYQGTMGVPSEVLNFSTLSRQTSTSNGPRNAETTYSIECSGDICVGDTVLITEQLFVKDSAKNAQLEQASRQSLSKKGGVLRMDMSVTSLPSVTDSQLLPPGAYIGDRTIAAHVVKDNYRTGRDGIAAKGFVPRNYKKFGRNRHIWLEVIWQQATTEACKPFELKKGEVIERPQCVLEEYEVYRMPWKDEQRRVGLDGEWSSMIDCYRTTECDTI